MKLLFSKYNTALAAFFNKPVPDRHEWLFIIALTVLLTLLLYANALNGYWRFDDGFHLMFATEYSPWQYFFDPAITRAQSGSNVTPWNVFFYDLNLSLFGFKPSAFYSHLLLLIIGSALAIYALLRIWLPFPSATLGAILFLAGKPTYHLTEELMSNHYLTGMLFSLLSLYFFISYIRHGNRIKLLSSVLLYALATTCKEVYVPLIILLFAIPVGDFKQRLRAILPFVLVAIVYAFWRHEVLGAWIGGYKANPAKSGYQVIIQQLTNIPFMLFDNRGWGLAGLISVTIMLLIAVWNRVLNLPLILVSVLFIFPPLIPLTISHDGIGQPDRYLFVLWAAISILAAVIFHSPKNSTRNKYFLQLEFIIKSLSVCVLFISCFIGQINERQRYKGIIHKAEDIYHFALETNFPQKALILDVKGNGEYWAFVSTEARRAYDISNKLSSPPILITVKSLNGLLLLGEMTKEESIDFTSIQFYHYHNGDFSPLNIKPIINSLLTSLNAGKDQMLQILFSHQKGTLSWVFQPSGIAYSAILWQGKSRLQYPILELPEKGSYPWSMQDELQISLSFTSPKGWIALSPKLKFDPGQNDLVWQGKTNLTLITDKLESLLVRTGDQKHGN